MAFAKKDLEKWSIIDKTTMENEEKEIAVYQIDIECKDLGINFRYIGQVHNQTIYDRYLQHTSKNGTIRKTIDLIGLENVTNINLKCLTSYKYRNKERLDKRELKLINKADADSRLLKKKQVYVLNTSMNKIEVIKNILKFKKAIDN